MDLPAASAAQEAVKLRLGRTSPLRRLLLKRAERSKLTLSVDNVFDRSSTEGADQLVLQVRDTHVETKRFHTSASEIGAEPCSLEAAPEVTLLSGVAKARQPDVEPPRAEQFQKTPDAPRTSNWHDRNALGLEIPATPLR